MEISDNSPEGSEQFDQSSTVAGHSLSILPESEPRLAGDRLIFVGGCPRSGSTLLQNMLDSHPHIAGGPEFDFVPEIVSLRNRIHQKIVSGRISTFASQDTVDRHIGILIEGLLFPYMERHMADYISEKTPSNVLFFKELLTIFPQAHFLFCIRDPRAVLYSMLAVGDRARAQRSNMSTKPALPPYTRSVLAAIETIKRFNRAGFDVAANERVHVVQYERLVESPEAMTREIAEFLGIVWDSALITPTSYVHGGDSLIDGIWAEADTYRGNPDPARAELWQNSLPTWQRLLVEAAFGNEPELRSLGYPLSTKHKKLIASVFTKFEEARHRMEGARSLLRQARRIL
jgi:Sulfotransferase family